MANNEIDSSLLHVMWDTYMTSQFYTHAFIIGLRKGK